MHELSIVQSILDAADTEARRRGAVRIKRIDCRIGVMRQVDRALLTEAFELARKETAASTASLEVIAVGMILACRECCSTTELSGWQFECPKCGSNKIELSGGDELELTSMELEVPNGD